MKDSQMLKNLLLVSVVVFIAACQMAEPEQPNTEIEHVNTLPEFSNNQPEQIPQSWQDAVSPDLRFITRHGYWSVLCRDSTKGCWAIARVGLTPSSNFMRVEAARIVDAPPHYRTLSVSFNKLFSSTAGANFSTASGLDLNYDFRSCSKVTCTSRAIFTRDEWGNLLSSGEITFSARDKIGRKHFATIGVKRLEEALAVAQEQEKRLYGDLFRGVAFP